MSTYLITGGAGFIGSHLVDALLADPGTRAVRVIDNFSSGRRAHLVQHGQDPRLSILEADLLALADPQPVFSGVDVVFHLAANPDARRGLENTRLDLEQETIASYNVLESMRRHGVRNIILSSSGTVYGDVGTTVTREDMGPCLPISLYGAGKVAAEALVSAFCGSFQLSGAVMRFGNVVGERTTHGAIYDFIQKLGKDPSRLEVLGDGNQAKPYVYVKDLVAALLFAGRRAQEAAAGACDVFNLAPPGATPVRFIAQQLVRQLGLEGRTAITFGSSPQGWAGDVAQSRMDASKLAAAGFQLARSSDDAVCVAIAAIHQWLKAEHGMLDGWELPRT